jgi:PD-(D/E)XK nuclease superfamily
MKPLPWSPSALETFKNCPEQYHHRYVLKDLPPEERSAEQIYGESVHEVFADRQRPKHVKLPPALAVHEPFMQELEAQPGWVFVEHKTAMAKSLEPCEWDDKNIWCRMIIDYLRIDAASRQAWIVDYKTGRPHRKFNQLIIYALWVFNSFAYIDTVSVQFYWTKDRTTTDKTWSREDVPKLWNELVGDLRQYREAFRSNIWQMRPSGLCKGWCPVIGCKYWRPKR